MSSFARRSYRQRLPRPENAEIVTEPEAAFARLGPLEAGPLLRWPAIERAFAEPPVAAPPVAAPGQLDGTAAPHVGAAVLLPLLRGGADNDEPDLVLIRRGQHLRANPGEIAFPGGRLERGESAYEAALREASEEVALPVEAVRLLGPLPTALRASRPQPIASFVGAVDGSPQLKANPSEVDAILLTPLVELADPRSYWEELWQRGDGELWRMSFFDRGDDVIWGASARILVSLFERLIG